VYHLILLIAVVAATVADRRVTTQYEYLVVASVGTGIGFDVPGAALSEVDARFVVPSIEVEVADPEVPVQRTIFTVAAKL
jgi:hypothetical protein